MNDKFLNAIIFIWLVLILTIVVVLVQKVDRIERFLFSGELEQTYYDGERK